MADVNFILVPFDLVFDIDMGLAKLVYFMYHNEEFFRLNLLKGNDILLKQLLLYRDERNPLYVFCKDTSNTELIDSLYSQFIEREYNQILQFSNITNLAKLIKTSSSVKDQPIQFEILCRSQSEIDLLSQRGVSATTLLEPDKSKVNITKYGTIYMKDTFDITLYNSAQLFTKNIYFANYGFNLIVDEKIQQAFLNPQYVVKYNRGRHLDFYIFSLYSFKSLEKYPKELKEETKNGK